jgi:hypothetical protein
LGAGLTTLLALSGCGGGGSGGNPDASSSRDVGGDGSDAGHDGGPVQPGWPREPAACGAWAEGTQADDDGVTRDFYNRAAGLSFRNPLGDFADAGGVEQGGVAFAVATVTDDNTPGWQSWDVTTLVQGWMARTWPNKGAVLTSPPGPFVFASREHAVAAQRPELVVTTASGTVTLSAAADSYVSSSTFGGFGDADVLRVGTGSNTFIRFDFDAPGLSGVETIVSATLRLYKLEDYGGGARDVSVFRSTHGYDRPLTAPMQGLSAAYPNDVNVGAHPAVLMHADFESSSWADTWTSGAADPHVVRVDSSEGNGFVPMSGSALRVEITAGDNYGAALIYGFMDEQGAEPEEMYFRYHLRFGEDWNPTDGGKLPGFSGTYGRAGWGGRPVDGTDGWSARGTYRTVIPDGNPLARHSAIGNYVYHADMAGSFGDVDLWLEGCAGLLDKNRWYSVETYIRMNTPGENDGVLRAWVDGRLAYERVNWRWRDVGTLKVEQVWMNFYHGGTAVPPSDLHAYIDNVVIATEYIGPLAR